VPVLSEEDQAKQGEEEGDAAGEGKAADKIALPSSQVIERPSDPLNAWSDYALSIGAELMQKCRREVLQQLGYTCSAGVARNKVCHLLAFSKRPKLIRLIANQTPRQFYATMLFQAS
jgi:DNA polymerase eta